MPSLPLVIVVSPLSSIVKDQVTVNPLLSPPGGLFFSSTFEGGLNREGGLKREGGGLI